MVDLLDQMGGFLPDPQENALLLELTVMTRVWKSIRTELAIQLNMA